MKNNKRNKAKNQVSSEVSRTDVLDATDVSRETLSEKEQRQAKKEMAKKVELDAVRKKGGITDDDPYDFDNPTLKELYRDFRKNKLSVIESGFNALYLWCYDNYYSSGVPVKNKYKNIYAHPSAWFRNAHHMWRHNKWSVAVKALEIIPSISRFFTGLKEKNNKATENFWRSIEYSRVSAKKMLSLCLSIASFIGIGAVVTLWVGAMNNFEMVPALSLFIDGKYVGEVLSISDAEKAKVSIEDTLSVNLGSSYKLDCEIEYKATKIAEGSNLTQARLSRAFSETAHKNMKSGYGLYAYDVLVAVVESRQLLEESLNESLQMRLSDEQKNDESIAHISYLNFTIREGTYPESFFCSIDEIRHMFSLPTLTDESNTGESQPADHLNVSDMTTLFATGDAGTSSDIQSDNNEELLHQIAIETVITKTETRNEEIPFDIVVAGEDPELAENKIRVVKEGVNGIKTATYHVEYVNNTEKSRRLINEVVVSEPSPQEIIKGIRPLTEEELRVKSTGTYIFPSPGEISSKYGWRTWGSYNEFHKGLDMRADKGLVLVASDGGEVIQATNKGDGYGLCILIKHDNGHITRYAHCSALHVEVGDKVAQGDYIADMGATGWVTGVHIHFEIIIDGATVDPLDYLIPRD